MKIFLDTADIKEIREAAAMGIADGVTTNPTLVAKTGRKYDDVLREICEVVNGPISAETIALDAEGMMKEARHFAAIHPNIVVKVPSTIEGLKAVRLCLKDGIRTNVTLCFSPTQALLIAKAGAFIVSPFVGRIDDVSEDGMELIQQVVTIYKNYGFKTQVLVASVRNPVHVVRAAMMGADIATIPFAVVQQLMKHPLTDIGIEKFLADWKKVPQ